MLFYIHFIVLIDFLLHNCLQIFLSKEMFCIIYNVGSLKRKSDVADLSNVSRQIPKTIGFNFASSTPTLITANKQQVATSSKYFYFDPCKMSNTFRINYILNLMYN